MKKITYCFDLDGTICTKVKNSKYLDALPIVDRVKYINKLYSLGHKILIYTARGSVSKINHEILTYKQLHDWGLNFHKLICNQKPLLHLC